MYKPIELRLQEWSRENSHVHRCRIDPKSFWELLDRLGEKQRISVCISGDSIIVCPPGQSLGLPVILEVECDRRLDKPAIERNDVVIESDDTVVETSIEVDAEGRTHATMRVSGLDRPNED